MVKKNSNQEDRWGEDGRKNKIMKEIYEIGTKLV